MLLFSYHIKTKSPLPNLAAGFFYDGCVVLLSVHSYPSAMERQDTRERVCSMRPIGERGKHRRTIEDERRRSKELLGLPKIAGIAKIAEIDFSANMVRGITRSILTIANFGSMAISSNGNCRDFWQFGNSGNLIS